LSRNVELNILDAEGRPSFNMPQNYTSAGGRQILTTGIGGARSGGVLLGPSWRTSEGW
jgi:hypothetical protein